MPPKKPAAPAGNKKTQEKKKEKIIEVNTHELALWRLALAAMLTNSSQLTLPEDNINACGLCCFQ